MSAEQGAHVKMRNVTKETLSFPCGTDNRKFGTRTVMVAGVPEVRDIKRQVERIITVKPGEVCEIEEGYLVERTGAGSKGRGSYLEEAGLKGKLVPVTEARG